MYDIKYGEKLPYMSKEPNEKFISMPPIRLIHFLYLSIFFNKDILIRTQVYSW